MTHDVSKLAIAEEIHVDEHLDAKQKAESDAIEKIT
jgi:hypothetical protein